MCMCICMREYVLRVCVGDSAPSLGEGRGVRVLDEPLLLLLLMLSVACQLESLGLLFMQLSAASPLAAAAAPPPAAATEAMEAIKAAKKALKMAMKAMKAMKALKVATKAMMAMKAMKAKTMV